MEGGFVYIVKLASDEIFNLIFLHITPDIRRLSNSAVLLCSYEALPRQVLFNCVSAQVPLIGTACDS